jgi:hypothetical protein
MGGVGGWNSQPSISSLAPGNLRTEFCDLLGDPLALPKIIFTGGRTEPGLSGNRFLVELIELGIEAQKQKEKDFFELAGRFRAASDPQQAKRLSDELGRLVFGE